VTVPLTFGTDAASLATRIEQAVMTGTVALPTMPDLCNRIIETTRSETTDANRLALLLEHEPATLAGVMRVANSASFVGLRPVSDMSSAVMRLGFRHVGLIATLVLHKGLFVCDTVESRARLARVWDHSVASATAARRLAVEAGVDPTEAFLAGLLHDTGCLLILKAVDQLARKGDPPIGDGVMNELMSLLHVRLGAHLIESWKLPTSVSHVALHHHDDPIESGDMLVAVVQVADAMANRIGAHLFPDPELDLLQVPGVSMLHLGELELAAQLVDLEDELTRLRSVL
jgi:HD-like signal output (HDOD) protein